MNNTHRSLTLIATALLFTASARAQTGTLDQDNTATTNVAIALQFNAFAYEQVVEASINGTLEGFVIRIAAFQPNVPTLPVAVYAWDQATASQGAQLWSGQAIAPTHNNFEHQFIDTTSAGIPLSTGDFIQISVGDPGADMTGWDLGLNQGWNQQTSTFVALYPHSLYRNSVEQPFDRMVFQTWMIDGPVGTSYCTATANSTGVPGSITASGSTSVATNDLTLRAADLPLQQFGIFVTSQTQGFVVGAGGTSNGNLCLGGTIGRFTNPNQIGSTGANGEFALTIDLAAIPAGSSFVSAAAGETWNFQAWHRDTVGLGSNFTPGLSIDLQ